MNNASDERALHIQLLGDFRLVYGDEPVTSIYTPRLQALLAYLLLHRAAPQSRHRMAFLFWPDSPEAQALTNLRNLLYRLRHELPDADRFLHVDRNTLQWRSEAPFEVDIGRFEGALDRADRALKGDLNGARSDRAVARAALEQAVALYEGDLLPSLYQDWIAPERERLRQAFERALGRLVRLLEDQQEYDAAIRYAQQLLRQDPLREASYRHLMRLRALVGDRAGALRTYHECATVVERELGVQPSQVTREVYERLLALGEAPTLPTRMPGRMVAISPLVGRQEGWAQLRGAWRIASGGRPHLVLISGEAGIGKTRLAEELLQWARRQGIATAASRCYAIEGELAYAPVAAWLRALSLPRMDRVWLPEIARILPDLLAEQPSLSPAGPLTESWRRRRFWEALARAVLGGDQPLLLLIDALQWCDRGTLEWLHYLLRFDPRARLLVVGAYRPEGIGDGHSLPSLRHALRQADQLTEIELDPLSKAETATLAANVANRDLEQNLIDCLYGETEGNPLFIVETVRAGLPDEVRGSAAEGFLCVPRPLPSRMKDALMARVDQLSPSARALAELAATIGREFTFDVLREATDAGEGVLVRGLDELWRRGIVREQGEDAYDFSHDKLREVIDAELSEARKRMLHRHVARALERVHTDNLDPVVARVAAHYERADEPEEAIEYYERAAQVAETMQVSEDAASYRRRASALLEGTATGES
jgi:DNA-binding SARP family transcriptional activator